MTNSVTSASMLPAPRRITGLLAACGLPVRRTITWPRPRMRRAARFCAFCEDDRRPRRCRTPDCAPAWASPRRCGLGRRRSGPGAAGRPAPCAAGWRGRRLGARRSRREQQARSSARTSDAGDRGHGAQGLEASRHGAASGGGRVQRGAGRAGRMAASPSSGRRHVLDSPDLPRRGRRHRRRQRSRRAHQAAGQAHLPARSDGRAGRLRRAVRPVRQVPRAGAGLRHRRRRHQAQAGAAAGPPRHHRHRPGRHVRQRRAGAGRRAAVLPRLFRHRQAAGGYHRGRGRRHRPRLRAGRLRADRRRDRGDARHVPAGRIRPGRLHRRRGGKIGAARRRQGARRRRAARHRLLGPAFQRLFAGAPHLRSRRPAARPRPRRRDAWSTR